MTIVLAGGSGYIGTELSRKLLSLGHRVIVIDVVAPSFTHQESFFIQCDISKNPLPYNVLEQTDAVVNLVGRSIQIKWTKKNLEEIRESRVRSTKHIVETIRNTHNKPSCFISASAIGFYSETGERECDERCERGSGELASIVSEWEAAAEGASELGVRTVLVRTAPVLSEKGILSFFKKTARFGFLLGISKKNFWMSWIHMDDIVSTYVFALETKTLQGVFNAAAPNPVEYKNFMKELSRTLHRKVLAVVPAKFSRMKYRGLFDEMTKSTRVTPKKLIDKGFTFLYPTIEGALKDILKKNHEEN